MIGGVRKQTRHRAAHRSLSMPELQSVGCRLEALRAAEECIEEGTLCLGMHKPAQDPSDYECSICTEMLLDPVVGELKSEILQCKARAAGIEVGGETWFRGPGCALSAPQII